MMTLFVIVAIMLLALSGAPLFAVILASSMMGFYFSGIDLSVIAIEMYRLTDTPLLVALPLFTFAGYLLSEGKSSQRLLNITDQWLHWMPGGLAVVALFSSAIFTAFTGASGVTIVALGALLYPALLKGGYDEKFSLGLVTTSGSLGLLFAPSLPLILYGIITQQVEVGERFTMEQLFIAGILPGLLMVIALSVFSYWKNKDIVQDKASFGWVKAKQALWDAKWEIPLPVFILLGIYGGVVTLTEIAAITALYVLIMEVFIHKEIKYHQVVKVITDSMTMTGSILLILGVSLALTNLLVDAEIPSKLFEIIQTNIHSKYTFLFLLNMLLLLLGAILDIFAALVIVVPIILPLAVGFGIHPIHLGIIFLANMQIGYLTPPIGMNLFIASYRFGQPITKIYKDTLPFMLILLIVLALITYIPELSLGFL